MRKSARRSSERPRALAVEIDVRALPDEADRDRHQDEHENREGYGDGAPGCESAALDPGQRRHGDRDSGHGGELPDGGEGLGRSREALTLAWID